MNRWLRELWHPAEKCERVGHRMRPVLTPVYLYPPDGTFLRGHVADRAVEVSAECRRCGEKTEVRITDRRGLNGLSMPTDKWETLEREGRLVR